MKRKLWIIVTLAVLIAALGCASALADDAGVTEYDLWVGGVRVTSENMGNIPGVTGGVARFDPATNTLTLTNVTGLAGVRTTDVYGSNAKKKCAIYWGVREPLTVSGKLTLSSTDTLPIDIGILSIDDLNLNGAIFSISTDYVGIFSEKNMYITNSTIVAEGDYGAFYVSTAKILGIVNSNVQAFSSNCAVLGKPALTFTSSTAEFTAGYSCFDYVYPLPDGYQQLISCYIDNPPIERIPVGNISTLYKHILILPGEKPDTKYYVQFSGNGLEINISGFYVWKDCQITEMPADPFVSGYLFGGWYLDAACTQPFDATQPITADITLYAKWTELPRYTVTFETGNIGTAVDAQSIPEGECAVIPAPPTAPNVAVFDGWFADSAYTTPFDFSAPITEDTTVYVKWLRYYRVSFYSDGSSGSMPGVSVLEDQPFYFPECQYSPPREGAVFVGWTIGYTSEIYPAGTQYQVTSHMALLARWKGPFTVTFDPDGGTGTMAAVTVGYGEAYTLPECGFTPPAGKKFGNWNVEMGDSTTLLWPRYTMTVKENMTLKPEWRAARATFQANGGTGILTPVDMVPDSSGYITLPECSLNPPDGRMFAGWLVGGTVYQPGQRAPIYGDTLIPAQWTTAHYTVTYDKNGGSGSMASFTTQGDTFTLPECGFTPPAGKQFAYWIVSAAVTNYKLYYPGQTVQINADTAVKAMWTDARPSSWTVSFMPDDGTGTMPSITVADLAYLTFPECGFTPPSGKTFEHWTLKTVDGAYMGTYHPGDQVQIYQNYIVWPYYRDLVTHYVNFYDPSNYNILNTQDIVEGGLVSVPEVSVPGYTLHGWYFRYRPDENSDWVTVPFDFGQPVEFYLALEGDPDGTAISVWADLTQNEHHIALTVSDGGTAQLDPAQDTYHYGDVVYINWEMDSGCHYEGITITPVTGESQALDYNYFTMPDCDVAVDVRFLRPVIHSGTFGDGLYWSLSEGHLTIGGVGAMPDFTWENEAPWMAWKNEIYGVEIQPGITAVGKLAFTNISGLGYASLPGTVTRIGSLAFYCCSALSEIQLPDGLTMIEDNAFTRTGLYDVSIPASVRVIEESAFEVCERLESVTLREGIEEIGSFAFGSCPLLREITIPQSVTMLGSYAFENCTSLQRVSGLEHVGQLPGGLFCECGSLTDIGLLPRVSVIPGDIFARCRSLSSIAIPSTVTRIEDWAFDECDSLTAVYYEGSRAMWDAIQIGDHNDGLEHATIHCKFALTFETYDGPEIASVLLDWDEIPVRPDNPKLIGAHFEGWYLEDSLDTSYDFSYPLNADTTLYAEWYSPDPHYTLRLPNMLTTIESEAFAGVKAYAVAVPRGVTFIADDAFPSRIEYVLGFPGTYAETWASTHGMVFIEIDDAWMASH